MLGNLGRRAIDLVVLLLALYAFAFVPLGKKTGLEHLRSILRTRPAEEAGHEILEAADRLRHRLLDADEPVRTRGTPVVPRLPRRAHPEANLKLAPEDAPDASQ